LQVDAVEAAVEAYHAPSLQPRAARAVAGDVREFVSARSTPAREQGRRPPASLEALKGEQKNLIQLHHKGLVDDEVLAEEQERIKVERATPDTGGARHARGPPTSWRASKKRCRCRGDLPVLEADDPVLWS